MVTELELNEFSIPSAIGTKFNTAEDVKDIIDELKSRKKLLVVRFSGHSIGVEAAKAIASTLKEFKSLTKVYLNDIFTGRLANEIPEALHYLLGAINQLPNAHTIDLSDNAFGSTAQEPLISFLSSHTPLQHLYLQNNGLGPESGAKIAKALLELYSKKEKARSLIESNIPPLESIVCGRNRLEDGSMSTWAEMFASHKTLKIVRMVQNGIRPNGIEHLLDQGLSSCGDLSVLDLQDNTFMPKGASKLAKNLKNWPKLRELCIGDCLIKTKGVKLLANAILLGNDSSIERLKLQYNEIKIDGVDELLQAISSKLPNLELLELNGNRFKIEDDSIKKLKDLFKTRNKGQLDDLDDLEDLDSEEEESSEEEDIEEEGTVSELEDETSKLQLDDEEQEQKKDTKGNLGSVNPEVSERKLTERNIDNFEKKTSVLPILSNSVQQESVPGNFNEANSEEKVEIASKPPSSRLEEGVAAVKSMSIESPIDRKKYEMEKSYRTLTIVSDGSKIDISKENANKAAYDETKSSERNAKKSIQPISSTYSSENTKKRNKNIFAQVFEKIFK